MKYSILFFIPIMLLTSCTGNKQEEKKEERTKVSEPAYQLATVEKGGVATVLKLPAQLAAYEEVSIFPKVNAYVKKVLVDVGTRVGKGQLLMVLEAPELEQAVLQAKEKYVRSRADYSIDREHLQRLTEAAKTAGAISPLDISTVKAKMEADSSVCNAERANWQMQQTMLGYLKVSAPFSGIITERNVHPGALVSAAVKDKPMLELKQIEHLRLQVDIPEGLAGTIKNKDTVSFFISALQGKKMKGFICRRSMNVNAQYRSERMEIDVPNNGSILSPGMYADVTLYSKGNTNAVWVPKSAVVISTEKKYVLQVQDGKSLKKIDISTGNQTPDKVEIYGNIQVGDKVVINANDEMKETKGKG